MTRSALAPTSVSTRKYSSREGTRVARLIIHHTAGGTNAGNVTLLSAANGYDVSTHYVCQTTGMLVGIVPEQFRAWTTGRAADLPSVTVETVNSSGAPSWAITDAQVEKLAQLAADLSKRYGWGALNRTNVRYHSQFMATACPGPYITARIDRIIERANAILGGSTVTPSTPSTPASGGAGTLKITSWPRGIYYLAKGDTPASVAKRFGMSAGRLRSLNGVAKTGFTSFRVGQGVTVALDYAPLDYQYLDIGTAHTLAVAQTQRRLKAAYKSYAGQLVIDGIYGAASRQAVAEFQGRVPGLSRSGRVDRKTWNAIHGLG